MILLIRMILFQFKTQKHSASGSLLRSSAWGWVNPTTKHVQKISPTTRACVSDHASIEALLEGQPGTCSGPQNSFGYELALQFLENQGCDIEFKWWRTAGTEQPVQLHYTQKSWVVWLYPISTTYILLVHNQGTDCFLYNIVPWATKYTHAWFHELPWKSLVSYRSSPSRWHAGSWCVGTLSQGWWNSSSQEGLKNRNRSKFRNVSRHIYMFIACIICPSSDQSCRGPDSQDRGVCWDVISVSGKGFPIRFSLAAAAFIKHVKHDPPWGCLWSDRFQHGFLNGWVGFSQNMFDVVW